MPVSTATRTVRLARPHAAQSEILAQRHRFNVVALGRRAGKSKLAQHLLVHCALERRPGGYFCPTYKLLEEFWRELKVVLAEVISDKSEQEKRLELMGGGTIDCWSMDTGDPARGRRYALVVIDEAAMVPRLSDIWAQAIRPTLSDFRGEAWFMSTPRGLNDFHTLYQRAQDPFEESWAAWQMPTSVNPYIAPAEIDSARHDLTEREFAQEYEARFLAIEGAGVFRGVGAVSRLEPTLPQMGMTYVIGCDWARSNDFTVFSVVNASLGEQVAIDRFSEVDYELQTERLHKWCELYRPTLVIAESNAMGRPLVERLQTGYARIVGKPRPALPVWAFETTNASKAAMVQSLGLAIERGELTLLDDQVQQAELLAFEATALPSGLMRYGAPVGQHDDTVIALGLAWLGAAREATPVPARQSYAFGGMRR